MTVYATPEQLYAQPGITVPDDTGTVDLMLAAASLAIDGFCNRAQDGFLATAMTHQRLYSGLGLPWLFIDEAVEITNIEWKSTAQQADWTTIDLADVIGFQGAPQDPNFNRFPYHALMLVGGRVNSLWPVAGTDFGWFWSEADRSDLVNQRKLPNVRVTGRWGYADVVPDPVIQATITQAARWYKRGQSFWADTAASPDFGVLSYRQALDPDIRMMLTLARLQRPTYG